jgi:uncharacterized membrane protein
MKIKNKKDALVIGGLLAGTVTVLGGIINCLHSYDFKHCSLIWVGLLILGSALYAMRRPETEVLPDERVTRINEKAGYVAFWLVLILITLLFWSDRTWSIGIELVDMYYAAMSVGIISWSVLRWYYNKKGALSDEIQKR